MTIAQGEKPRILSRPVLRMLWAIHRAAYRITGGRFGLTRPKVGERFGMMRLHTVGRRSGKEHTVIVGYVADGPNLVSLAMNGWAEDDPAWWLNLQASPKTTVDLSDGKRAVTARLASEAERHRLWVRLGDYPGWGDDLDLLAARRTKATAVVVLEPRDDNERGISE